MASSDYSKITATFPHKHLPAIVGAPNYESIKELHLKLNENAIKVHSNLGGGALGYLGITVEPAIYTTLSATPFQTPPNPGATPVFPVGATSPAIANIRVVFVEETANFNQYIAVSNALAAQIIEAIDHITIVRG